MATTKRVLKLEEIAIMLRAKCPSLQNRVGGMSMFNNVKGPELNLPVPYCVIASVSKYGDPYNKATRSQMRYAVISCIVCVSNVDQKESGAGKNAVLAADSVDPIVAEIEDAFLTWKPVSIAMSETPLYMDEGYVGSDNTKLWHEVNWQIAYEVYNPAFGGPGVEEALDDDEPWTWERLAIHYGVTPNPFLLDANIYGPMVNPPTLESIETRVADEAQIYTVVDGKPVLTQAKNPDYDNQERGTIVKTVIDP